MNDAPVFELFNQFNKNYPQELTARMSLLYEAYMLLCKGKFSKFSAYPQHYNLARQLSFGMLLRHSLEAIVISAAAMNDIDHTDKTIAELIRALSPEEGPSCFSSKTARALNEARFITNGVAHPYILENRAPAFLELWRYYRDTFQYLLKERIAWLSAFRCRFFLRKTKKAALKYLRFLKSHLDDFDIKDQFSSVLLRGSLVRQLTECTVNYFGYNYGIVPTDASTEQQPIEIGGVLDQLSAIAKHRYTYEDSIPLYLNCHIDEYTVSCLFKLKNLSNSMVHVDSFNPRVYVDRNYDLTQAHPTVAKTCALEAIRRIHGSITEHKPLRWDRTTGITTLLCGLLGFTGAHHFYVGNKMKGIFFLLTGGLLTLGPAISLVLLMTGAFQTKKWGELPKTSRNSLLAFVFFLIYPTIAYIFFSTIGNFLLELLGKLLFG